MQMANLVENPFERFSRAASSEAELRQAMEGLGAVIEPPSFWSAIANDASMPVAHRKWALVQLVRRHVLPGLTTVGVFVEMLDGARWLSDTDIVVINVLGGKIPVKWSLDDTVIAIALPGGHGAIYLAISGRIDTKELAGAFRGLSREERVLSAVIREVGLDVDG
jgi:hypothetical protein